MRNHEYYKPQPDTFDYESLQLTTKASNNNEQNKFQMRIVTPKNMAIGAVFLATTAAIAMHPEAVVSTIKDIAFFSYIIFAFFITAMMTTAERAPQAIIGTLLCVAATYRMGQCCVKPIIKGYAKALDNLTLQEAQGPAL